MMEISTNTQIGIGLTCMGLAFIFLGIILLFDKGLLAIGNVSIHEAKFCIGYFHRNQLLTFYSISYS